MAKPPEAWAPAVGPPAESRLERELVTPEGVDLRLRLAEASERAAAFLLDAAIMVGILVVLTVVAIGAMIGAGGKGGTPQIIMVIWLLGFYILFGIFESLWQLPGRLRERAHAQAEGGGSNPPPAPPPT